MRALSIGEVKLFVMMDGSGTGLHVFPCRSGKACRFQAWKLKRLVSVFSRVAKRGHYPRERGIRRIFTGAGIPLPSDPRHLPNKAIYIASYIFFSW